MALTEKGKAALHYIKKFFPKGQFTAKELSDACGERFVAATLNSVANNGYIVRYETTPISYAATNDLDELITALENENKGCDNSALTAAKKAKNDEFYTFYEDIEAEVSRYAAQFKDKIVYLPCDDPADDKNTEFKRSEFWSYFMDHFNDLQLKRLIATHYEDDHSKAYKIWVDRKPNNEYVTDDDVLQEPLNGDGDFRSPECIEILKSCDIVCTNPPFSYFKEFVPWILNHNKHFLIIGNQNAFTYKEIFPYIRDEKIWVGYNMIKTFLQPDGSIKKFGNVCWFTNLYNNRQIEPMILTKSYYEAPYNYPKYDNYDAIEVGRLVDIPKDYNGIMGVPITFINKHCLTQFKIVGCSYSYGRPAEWPEATNMSGSINGKDIYKRILIKKKISE